MKKKTASKAVAGKAAKSTAKLLSKASGPARPVNGGDKSGGKKRKTAGKAAAAGGTTSPAVYDKLACIVLAAGKGTRMKSEKSKVLHTILGAPLCAYPIDRAREAGAHPVVAVLGHQREDVEAALAARYGKDGITVVEQTEQRGTGHAVKVGLEPLAGWQGLVLILYGDAPLLKRETIEALLAEARRTGGLAILTARLPDPTGYGRIIRGKKGRVHRVVEQKDATAKERKIDEINAGFYAAPGRVPARRNRRAETQQRPGRVLPDRHRRAGQQGRWRVDGREQRRGDLGHQRSQAADRRRRGDAPAQHRALCRARDLSRRRVDRGRAGGGDWPRRRDRPQRFLARDNQNRRRRAHRRRRDLDRHRGRPGRRDQALLRCHRIGDRSRLQDWPVRAPASRHRRWAPDVHLGNFVETKKTRMGKGSKANHLTLPG